MRSRLAASAKKANTRLSGSDKSIEVVRTWSITLFIVMWRLAPLRLEPRPYRLDPVEGCLLKLSVVKRQDSR